MIGSTVIETRTLGDTLGELARWGRDALDSTIESARLDAELLLAHAVHADRSVVMAHPERAVDPAARAVFERFVERRRAGEPIAYLLGRREFYSLSMAINDAVLVPRPETELLVDTALALLPRGAPSAVLDLGTGSGAIALAIKHERPASKLTAIDVSRAALAMARDNAAALGLEIELLESDWFGALAGRRYDLIVANPPYVQSHDSAFRGALRHEPRMALDGGPDGLDAIRAILRAARGYLRTSAPLLLEHGETQGQAARELAAAYGYRDASTVRDLAGLDRVLLATAT